MQGKSVGNLNSIYKRRYLSNLTDKNNIIKVKIIPYQKKENLEEKIEKKVTKDNDNEEIEIEVGILNQLEI